jgi:hypothetical protein
LSGQYRELLAQSFESVYRSVSELCRHKNKDVKNAAFLAFESFLKEVMRACDFDHNERFF